MYSSLLASVAIVLVALLTLLAVKNKTMFAMGLRNIARRPKNTAIIIAALLVSTAIISGSFVASDSLNYAVVKATYDALGNVDEIVTMNGQPFNFSIYEKLVVDRVIANNTDGLSPSLYGQVPSVDDVSSGITSTQVTLVGLNFSTDALFGQFTLLNGTQTDASNLSNGQVLINNKLAQDLNAHTGDKLTIYYGGNESSLKAYTFAVKYIAKDEGKALYGLNENIFVTIDAAQAVFQNEGQINEIRISNIGNAESGIAASQDVSGLVAKSLSNSSGQFDVKAVKQETLASAQHNGAFFSNLLAVLAALSVIASAMLIVNVFVTLGEERKSEHGLARAIGMKRRHLVLMFLFEGTMAAVLAAAIGSVLGVGIGAGVLSILNTAFGTTAPEASLVLHYDLSDLLTAFLLGVFITITTVAFSSFRIGRLNIAGTLRNLEQPSQKTRRAFGVFLVGVALIAFGLTSYVMSQDTIVTRVAAPIVGVAGLALIIQEFFTRRLALSIAGVLLILYASYSALANPTNFSNFTESVVFAAYGVLLLVGAVLVVLANTNIWLKGMSKLLGKFASVRPLLMPAVAYSSQKRSHFQMTVIIMSVVIFLIVLASVSAAVYNPDIEKQTGGYDIRVTTAEPLTNLTMLQVKSLAPELGTSQVALLNESKIDYYDGLFMTNLTGMAINGQTPTSQVTEKDAIYGIDENFTEHSRYSFEDTLKGFNSSQDVWGSLNDPGYVVIDSSYVYGTNATQVKAGDVVSITTANGTARLTVAGVLDEYYLHGIFMSKQQMLRYFPAIEGDTLFLIKSEAGMKPIDLSYDLKKGYKIAGINAFLIRDELLQMTRQSQLLFQLMATYLGLGLIVGIASVGVITSRSAIERRREIGIMRAIGFTRSLIAKSLICEVILAISLALLVGLSTGLVYSAAIYLSLDQAVKAPFSVPVAQLAVVFVAVYVGTIVWTIIPARKASLVPPAEAIRYVE